MNKKDLLLAWFILASVSVFAQPGITQPVFNDSRDAKLVFQQDFESDWTTWTTTPANTITQVEYYNHEGITNGTSFKPWDEPDKWQRGLFKDTTIVLYNGVTIAADESEIWNETPEQNSSLVHDYGTEKIDRLAAMSAFGESGGNYYFKFETDTAPYRANSSSYSNGLSARYCRYLAIHGLNINENSSYRLTFYTKANTLEGHNGVTPTLYAGVMRGFPYCEKPISMGYINDATNYKYNNAFEYTKDHFNGDWEKVTFMTYYQTDYIAENYFYANGYWWADGGYWTWSAKNNGTGHDLNYIVQPDNFFVRLSFASNYTEFCLDNISLTKSYIGGIDYYQDMLRVDFGYQTNLKELAHEAYVKTRIDAVEVPGQYFEVWGLKSNGTWTSIGIESAEYHGDGYMYMFTDNHASLDDYQKVLVSFTNPTEKELQLKYTGTLFPKANNIEWIKAGKIVENFYNEEAQLNPYAFAGVYSVNNRPPVMQQAITAEEGSFGLDGSIRELKFKFSSEMQIDNPSNKENRNKCIVYVGQEIWDRTWDATNNTLTLTRPSNYTAILSGDVVVQISNIYRPNADLRGDDVIVNYHFGSIDRDLSNVTFSAPLWDSKFYDTTVNPGDDVKSPAGTAIAYSQYSWFTSSNPSFIINNGTNNDSAARLYRYTTEGLSIPRAVRVSPRNSTTVPARFYLGYGDDLAINLNPGSYALRYKAQPVNKIIGFKVFVYPWTQNPLDVEDADKVLVSDHCSFDKYYNDADYNSVNNNVDTILTTQFNDGFIITKGGRYIVEICVNPYIKSSLSAYPSMLFSNFELSNAPVYFGPISTLNAAIADAQARAALATDDKYAGEARTVLDAIIHKYKDGGTWVPTGKPSDWYAATKTTTDVTEAMKLRMDTVDMVVNKIAQVAQKLTDVATDNPNWPGLPEYNTLKATKNTADSYIYSTKRNSELLAFIELMDNQMEALDNRIKDNKQFNIELTKAQSLFNEAAQVSYPEYGELQNILNYYQGFDPITATHQQLLVALADIFEASYAYNYKIGIKEVGTRRVKELAAMADALNTQIGENAIVQERYQNLSYDDDYLADIYKAAIKVAIYEKICNGDNVNNIDLTPFIKNYYLYATPKVVERMDYQQPRDRSFLKYDEMRDGEYQVAHTTHQYNNQKPIWIVLTQSEFTNLIPGWTISAGDGGGNDMISIDSLYYDTNYKTSNLENGHAVFDGAISLEWGSEASLVQSVSGLPAGQFELGLDVKSIYNYSNKTSRGQGKLEVGIDGHYYQTELVTGWFLPETILVSNEDDPTQFDEIVNTASCDTTIFTSVSFSIPDNKNLDIVADAKAANGSAQIDNFKLIFNPDNNFDYAATLADARAQLNELLTNGPTEPSKPQAYDPADKNYSIYVENSSVYAGREITIPIKMKNKSSIRAFSFDIVLPSGLSFVSATLSSGRSNGHSLSSNVIHKTDKDSISFACISMENNTFTDNDGPVINLIVRAADEVEGDFRIKIENTEMVVSATRLYNPESSTGTISVLPVFTPGDVNKDDIISLADAVGVVAFTTNSNVQNLNHHAADANQNGTINSTDASLIVDCVLGRADALAQLNQLPIGTSAISSSFTNGAYGIYLDNATTDAGSQIVIPIKMKNQSSITAFSFDIDLPSGLTLVNTELVGTRANGHTLSSEYKHKWDKNSVSIACISMNNNAFTSTDGAVVNLTFNVSKGMEADNDICIKNIELVASATQVYNPGNFTGKITVNPVYDPGDVNKDGKISIADAVGVISFIINSDVEGLDSHAADANQDGTIDVVDVVWIVNRVIGKMLAPSRTSTNTEISSTLTLNNEFNNGQLTIPVCVEGTLNEITAVQFNATIPDGLRLKKYSTGSTHMVVANKQNDGSYTVVCFSLNNSTFYGGGSAAISLDFDFDDSFTNGSVILKDVKLVTPDCRCKIIDLIDLNIKRDMTPTDINSISIDSNSDMYDLQGRKIESGNGIIIRNNKKLLQTR